VLGMWSSALAGYGGAQSARRILGRLDRRAGVSDSCAISPTLLLFLLACLPRQFPLLSSLVIVRLCHDYLTHLRRGWLTA
jgi:hypothetical protein